MQAAASAACDIALDELKGLGEGGADAKKALTFLQAPAKLGAEHAHKQLVCADAIVTLGLGTSDRTPAGDSVAAAIDALLKQETHRRDRHTPINEQGFGASSFVAQSVLCRLASALELALGTPPDAADARARAELVGALQALGPRWLAELEASRTHLRKSARSKLPFAALHLQLLALDAALAGASAAPAAGGGGGGGARGGGGAAPSTTVAGALARRRSGVPGGAAPAAPAAPPAGEIGSRCASVGLAPVDVGAALGAADGAVARPLRELGARVLGVRDDGTLARAVRAPIALVSQLSLSVQLALAHQATSPPADLAYATAPILGALCAAQRALLCAHRHLLPAAAHAGPGGAGAPADDDGADTLVALQPHATVDTSASGAPATAPPVAGWEAPALYAQLLGEVLVGAHVGVARLPPALVRALCLGGQVRLAPAKGSLLRSFGGARRGGGGGGDASSESGSESGYLVGIAELLHYGDARAAGAAAGGSAREISYGLFVWAQRVFSAHTLDDADALQGWAREGVGVLRRGALSHALKQRASVVREADAFVALGVARAAAAHEAARAYLRHSAHGQAMGTSQRSLLGGGGGGGEGGEGGTLEEVQAHADALSSAAEEVSACLQGSLRAIRAATRCVRLAETLLSQLAALLSARWAEALTATLEGARARFPNRRVPDMRKPNVPFKCGGLRLPGTVDVGGVRRAADALALLSAMPDAEAESELAQILTGVVVEACEDETLPARVQWGSAAAAAVGLASASIAPSAGGSERLAPINLSPQQQRFWLSDESGQRPRHPTHRALGAARALASHWRSALEEAEGHVREALGALDVQLRPQLLALHAAIGAAAAPAQPTMGFAVLGGGARGGGGGGGGGGSSVGGGGSAMSGGGGGGGNAAQRNAAVLKAAETLHVGVRALAPLLHSSANLPTDPAAALAAPARSASAIALATTGDGAAGVHAAARVLEYVHVSTERLSMPELANLGAQRAAWSGLSSTDAARQWVDAHAVPAVHEAVTAIRGGGREAAAPGDADDADEAEEEGGARAGQPDAADADADAAPRAGGFMAAASGPEALAAAPHARPARQSAAAAALAADALTAEQRGEAEETVAPLPSSVARAPPPLGGGRSFGSAIADARAAPPPLLRNPSAPASSARAPAPGAGSSRGASFSGAIAAGSFSRAASAASGGGGGLAPPSAARSPGAGPALRTADARVREAAAWVAVRVLTSMAAALAEGGGGGGGERLSKAQRSALELVQTRLLRELTIARLRESDPEAATVLRLEAMGAEVNEKLKPRAALWLPPAARGGGGAAAGNGEERGAAAAAGAGGEAGAGDAEGAASLSHSRLRITGGAERAAQQQQQRAGAPPPSPPRPTPPPSPPPSPSAAAPPLPPAPQPARPAPQPQPRARALALPRRAMRLAVQNTTGGGGGGGGARHGGGVLGGGAGAPLNLRGGMRPSLPPLPPAGGKSSKPGAGGADAAPASAAVDELDDPSAASAPGAAIDYSETVRAAIVRMHGELSAGVSDLLREYSHFFEVQRTMAEMRNLSNAVGNRSEPPPRDELFLDAAASIVDMACATRECKARKAALSGLAASVGAALEPLKGGGADGLGGPLAHSPAAAAARAAAHDAAAELARLRIDVMAEIVDAEWAWLSGGFGSAQRIGGGFHLTEEAQWIINLAARFRASERVSAQAAAKGALSAATDEEDKARARDALVAAGGARSGWHSRQSNVAKVNYEAGGAEQSEGEGRRVARAASQRALGGAASAASAPANAQPPRPARKHSRAGGMGGGGGGARAQPGGGGARGASHRPHGMAAQIAELQNLQRAMRSDLHMWGEVYDQARELLAQRQRALAQQSHHARVGTQGPAPAESRATLDDASKEVNAACSLLRTKRKAREGAELPPPLGFDEAELGEVIGQLCADDRGCTRSDCRRFHTRKPGRRTPIHGLTHWRGKFLHTEVRAQIDRALELKAKSADDDADDVHAVDDSDFDANTGMRTFKLGG